MTAEQVDEIRKVLNAMREQRDTGLSPMSRDQMITVLAGILVSHEIRGKK